MTNSAFYAGFRDTLQKQAGYEEWSAAHPLAKGVGYFTPVVSTGLSVADAASDFRAGRWGAGALSSLWALATLVPGGHFIRGMSVARRLGQAAQGTHALMAAKAVGPAVGRARALATVADLSSRTGVKKFFTPFRGTRINRAQQIVNGQRAGIRNTIRDAYNTAANPVREGISGAVASASRSSPTFRRLGEGLSNRAQSTINGLEQFHGARPGYTGVVKALQWPAIGVSMAMPSGQPEPAQPSHQPQYLASKTSPYQSYAYKAAAVKTAQLAFTYGDLVRAISNDPTLSHTEKEQALRDIRIAFPSASESTPIQPNVAGAIGATVAWVLSRYAGMSTAGKVISSLAGFGVGRAIANKLNDPYPGYHSLMD